jgi:hypothetical protein
MATTRHLNGERISQLVTAGSEAHGGTIQA